MSDEKRVVKSGEVPDEARSAGGLNASVGPEVRNPEPVPTTQKGGLDKGPNIGDDGSYRPAVYKTKSGAIRQDR